MGLTKLISGALKVLCFLALTASNLAMSASTSDLDSYVPRTPALASSIFGRTDSAPDDHGRQPQTVPRDQCGSTACDCDETGAPRFDGQLPAVLYRVDTRPPTDGNGTGIFETGFIPRGRGLDLVDHVLRSRGALQSGYVAAADSPEGAAMFAAGYFAFNPDVTTLWIYTVRATDSFHNVEQSLRRRLASTSPTGADHARIEQALAVSRLQREWVTADPVAPTVIQRGHELSRNRIGFNPNSPHVYINDGYQSGDTRASCRLI